jgi:hypothetical protein
MWKQSLFFKRTDRQEEVNSRFSQYSRDRLHKGFWNDNTPLDKRIRTKHRRNLYIPVTVHRKRFLFK